MPEDPGSEFVFIWASSKDRAAADLFKSAHHPFREILESLGPHEFLYIKKTGTEENKEMAQETRMGTPFHQ